MPCDYKKYDPDWKTKIRPAALLKANNCCEECGVRNYSLVRWDKDAKRWERACGSLFIDQLGAGECSYKEAVECAKMWNENDEDPRWIVICLTIAHLNHDVKDNRPENLKALCQRHHLAMDQALHKANSRATIEKKKGLQKLF